MQPDPVGAEYGFRMPFVVCASNGGPFNDDAFVAGWQAAAIDAALATGPGFVEIVVPAALLPQLELMAMHRGYVLRFTHREDHLAVACCRFDKLDPAEDHRTLRAIAAGEAA